MKEIFKKKMNLEERGINVDGEDKLTSDLEMILLYRTTQLSQIHGVNTESKV